MELSPFPLDFFAAFPIFIFRILSSILWGDSMNFEFYTASRIIFGAGTLNKLTEFIHEMGNKALIVLGGGSLRKSGIVDRLSLILKDTGAEIFFYEGIDGEPEVETIDRGVEIALKNKVNLVIGMGGGSVIDTAKAISGIATNGGSVLEYLEGVGSGKVITKDSLPYIAIPTTSGTGAEVTKNSVILSQKQKFKKSIRSFKLIPNIALVDPELTLGVPPQITAYCGMDALTQLIEPYTSKKAKPFTDALAIYGIPFIARSLLKAVRDGSNLPARTDMALGSLLSGCALANSGLGAAHGIAASLGANFGIPHGLACGILLPHVMKMNMTAETGKFADIGEALTGMHFSDRKRAAEAGVEFVRKLAEDIGIPTNLKSFGITKEDIPSLAKNSRGSSMSGNPVELSNEELEGFLMNLI